MRLATQEQHPQAEGLLLEVAKPGLAALLGLVALMALGLPGCRLVTAAPVRPDKYRDGEAVPLIGRTLKVGS